MINTLAAHLLHGQLKQGPARELYKLSTIKFIQTIAKETSIIQQCIPISMYMNNLRIPETQIFAWSTAIEIINEVKYSNVSESLLNYAVDEFRNSIQYLHRYSPELQDAMFDFLYDSLVFLSQNESSDFIRCMDICEFVLREVRLHIKKTDYCERDCYLRLLGKSYVTLSFLNKVEHAINLECTNEVYSSLCDNLWITSLPGYFRRSVFKIMKELFLACYKHEEYRCK